MKSAAYLRHEIIIISSQSSQSDPSASLRSSVCLLFTCKQERSVEERGRLAQSFGNNHDVCARQCMQDLSAREAQYFSQPFPATKLRLMYQFTRREESRYTFSNNTREIKSCGEVHRKIISLIISQDISLDVRLVLGLNSKNRAIVSEN